MTFKILSFDLSESQMLKSYCFFISLQNVVICIERGIYLRWFHVTGMVVGFHDPRFCETLLLTLISYIKWTETAILKGSLLARHTINHTQPFISGCRCSFSSRSGLSFSFQMNALCLRGKCGNLYR